MSSGRKAFFHAHGGEAGRESLTEAGTVLLASWPLVGDFARHSCSGETALPLSQSQGLRGTQRSRGESSRPETSSNLESSLFPAKQLHHCPGPTGSSLRTRIMKTAQSEHSQEGPEASKRVVLTVWNSVSSTRENRRDVTKTPLEPCQTTAPHCNAALTTSLQG